MGGILGLVTVFVLAAFVGFEVVSKVPSILHTPLMSGTNAIHGIILVGAILIAGTAHGTTQDALGMLAVVLATLNVVGGFVVTDRMLEMFKGKSPRSAGDATRPTGGPISADDSKVAEA
ncbi:MAG: NAD(P) transhydrogenase subunit alpha part 2 [Acidimicrobiales bacterium]